MKIKTLVLLVLMLLLSVQSSIAQNDNAGRIAKSAVFPGMGQLADDQIVKGLGFMAAEVICLSLTFNQVSKIDAYARETQILEVRSGLANTYQEKLEVQTQWQKSTDKRQTAIALGTTFGLMAAACWGLNIIDAVMFSPGESEASSLLRNIDLAIAPNSASLKIDF